MTDPVQARLANARELILRCLDGAATANERAALDELVTQDPRVARELAQAASFESLLESASREQGDELFAPAISKPMPRHKFPLWVIAAALAVCGVGAAFVLVRSRPPAAQQRATSPALSVSTPRSQVPSVPAGPAENGVAEQQPASPKAALPSGDVGGPSTPAPSAVPSAPARSAADALQAANELRRQARWGDAARAYARIATEYRGSAQGSVAALAAAALHLEHLNDARGALRLYRAALGVGALSAEAQLGIADCYHALGDRDGEVAALDRFLSKYPGAMSRDRAARRLATLRAAAP